MYWWLVSLLCYPRNHRSWSLSFRGSFRENAIVPSVAGPRPFAIRCRIRIRALTKHSQDRLFRGCCCCCCCFSDAILDAILGAQGARIVKVTHALVCVRAHSLPCFDWSGDVCLCEFGCWLYVLLWFVCFCLFVVEENLRHWISRSLVRLLNCLFYSLLCLFTMNENVEWCQVRDCFCFGKCFFPCLVTKLGFSLFVSV